MAKKKNKSVVAVSGAEQYRRVAAAEDIVIPVGVLDVDVQKYVLSEMDDRLNVKRAEANKDEYADELLHPAQKPVEEAESVDIEVLKAALSRHVELGMKFEIDDEGVWSMKRGLKEDSGNLKMPLRLIVRCADNVCSRTFVPKMEKDGKDEILMV